jgi:hypothetical protein
MTRAARIAERAPWLRELYRVLPEGARSRVRSTARNAVPGRRVRWGNLRRLSPVSTVYGVERGTPVDRWYMHEFFRGRRELIRGSVLEVQGTEWSTAYGGADVRRVDILDVDPTNPRATVVADLCDPASLPESRYDCIVLPQTLQYLADLDTAIRNLWRAKAAGGTVLITAPTISKLDPTCGSTGDRWRFTNAALDTLVSRNLPDASVEIVEYGNVLTAVSFLLGIAAEELSPAELAHRDPEFPLLVCASISDRGAA